MSAFKFYGWVAGLSLAVLIGLWGPPWLLYGALGFGLGQAGIYYAALWEGDK